METSQGFIYLLGWFGLRFGIPIVLTILMVWAFRRLDARWQEQAETTRKLAAEKGLVPIVRCWLLNDCPDEKREKCPAYLEQHTPCWQHFRMKNGELKQACLGCGVFRGAPAPGIGD